MLLILAGVAIVTLTGENGILAKAQLAKERVAEKEAEENERITQYENEINSYVDGNRDTVTISKEEYNVLKNANSYSTEQIEIGKWINNDKLYRKTYEITLSNTNASQAYAISDKFNVKTIDAYIFNGNIIIPSGFYDGSIRFSCGVGGNYINLLRANAGDWAGCKAYVTIEYTISE